MGLFRLDLEQKKLTSIKGSAFRLERDLQDLLEANLESVFGLRFITSEFALNSLRIDSLAYDEQTSSFVVIEYKRDRSTSVIDQGYSYLALVLNNKADFVLEFNERMQTSKRKSDFDWTATRIVFVAARFTSHQLGAIEFRDLPIELWEVQPYEGSLMSIEQRLSDPNAASIKSVSHAPGVESSRTVDKEIRTYSVDDVFPRSHEAQRELFEALDGGTKNLDPAISEAATKSYVGYRLGSNWRLLMALNPLKSGIRIEFTRTQPSDLTDPKGKLVHREKSVERLGNHLSYMVVETPGDVEYALLLIQQVHKRFVDEFGSQ